MKTKTSELAEQVRKRVRADRRIEDALPGPRHWASEEVYNGADEYLDAVFAAIDGAKRTVEVESYIFDLDSVGERMLSALRGASARGARVRLLVDSFGSLFTKNEIARRLHDSGVGFRVYHEFPWIRASLPRESDGAPRGLSLTRRLNQRNHRKTVVVDTETAFAGDVNMSAQHSVRAKGQAAFRSTGVRVQGEAIAALSDAFERAWQRRFTRADPERSALVWLNFDRRLRRRYQRELIRLLRTAKQRVWVRNAYFLPTRRLLLALKRAVANGADVRLILPKNSDVFFFPWMASLFYEELLSSGVQIFEYAASPLHAKTMIVDELFLIGSTNLNRRSVFHDLEVDIRIGTSEAQEKLVQIYVEDLAASDAVKPGESKLHWYQKAFAYALLPFRHYL